MAQDATDKAFLAELEALEKFRISYTGKHPSAPLAREDPDVRRLIEAMAMFTARTRVAAQRNVAESMLRVFRQHFPYVLSPQPAMAMLRARVTPRYVDVTEVPRGAEVFLTPYGQDSSFRFRTMSKVRLLPLEIEGVETFRLRGRGWRIALRLTAAFPRNDEVNELPLYINHLNDLFSSLMVMHALRTHVRGVTVVYGPRVGEDSQGQRCEVYFGAPKCADHERDAFEHPLQRARSFLRFPQQELFVNVTGIKPPRNWRELSICFDVDDAWPLELRLTADDFQLHTVPIVNVCHDTADPIECDGTKERYPVRHPDRAAKYVPHSILGTYVVSEEGMVPLEPTVAGVGGKSYEALCEGHGPDRAAWVTLVLPGAFENPVRVAIDALWHQPAVSALPQGEFRVRLGDRFVDGVDWAVFGPVVAHADSELDDDRDALLQLLSIKNQRFLNAEELKFLMRALGAHRERAFERLVTGIHSLTVSRVPYAKRSGGFKHIYDMRFEDLDGSDLPRLELFCRHVLDILVAWSVEEIVELVVRVPNLEKELRFA